ncbi:hypothetical protein FACS189472_18220 [Alphaproteobacteria bacterium]|nr:hypothetical protein FACS189472_18220 [Alphaproteobacteria bacterium]
MTVYPSPFPESPFLTTHKAQTLRDVKGPNTDTGTGPDTSV